ncbi:YDG/SRA domain-containing protein [Hymenobacter sp. H14-R3]|uniref:YDG/SRA domain-containing protein n=1 Tax=Hymenobacter sp. H14-R3 TaxID=3046308 RepID=UPI0024B8F2EA|nr:YDG/SRA domain-containing protein [Hymenobacter sp. H14-R3]MDJ0365461.1 YDG/SRA domain-containing protein [Hymenobacter sp. H14-R3]
MAKSASVFGPVPGIALGHEFANRLELWGAGVHRQTQAGISARQGEGAESIVLSGGYEDDEDLGAVIIYTGRGGRSAESQQQVADQTLTGANRELARNVLTGLPVRVTRKVTEAGRTFYRYAGLYRIASYWAETGKSGHRVWRFRLEELVAWDVEPHVAAPAADLFTAQEPAPAYGPAPRRLATTLRLVRDTAVTRQVKALHDYHCQVCSERLASPAGPYAEAAHIRPLGAPHHGPDVLANVLCLCPNHHVLFDLGSFGVADNGALLGLPGQLRRHPQHAVAPEFLAYHRAHFYEPQAGELA